MARTRGGKIKGGETRGGVTKGGVADGGGEMKGGAESNGGEGTKSGGETSDGGAKKDGLVEVSSSDDDDLNGDESTAKEDEPVCEAAAATVEDESMAKEDETTVPAPLPLDDNSEKTTATHDDSSGNGDMNIPEDGGIGKNDEETVGQKKKKKGKKRKRKSKKNGKGKAKKQSEGSDDDDSDDEKGVNSEEEEEDFVERFQFEVEEDVAMFVDELSRGRREMPESEDEREDPMVERNRRIRLASGEKLVVGRVFLSGLEFKEAVLNYALKTGYNVRQNKYGPEKFSFRCGIVGKCKWRIYCSFDRTRQVFIVRTTYLHHSCTPNGFCNYLKCPVIARLFMDKLRLNPHFMPQAIQNHIKEQWKFVSTISQCQRGRLQALAAIDKEYADQYAHIRGYAAEILDSNPGSTAVVETVTNEKGDDVFNRIYICFETIKSCWRGSCRPIIGLDGTFLKNAVKGCLLAAVGHDANNQIYPIAWAVVQSESIDNWVWFVKLLKSDYQLDDVDNLVIISDRGRGLLAAVKDELPKAEHRACVKHIIENIKTKGHAGKDLLKPLVWNLAWSYNETDYKHNLQTIMDYDMELYNAVMNEKPETWTLAFYRRGSWCEDVDNNSTESFNATIVKARTKSLIPMLETMRRQVMERTEKRRRKSMKHPSKFSKYVMNLLAEEKEDADRCKTFLGSHGHCEVVLDGQSYKVNLLRRTCSCGKWQISGIPCEHAYGGMIASGVDVEDYIEGIFTTFFWEACYDTNILPMRGPRYWMNSDYRLVTAPTPPTPPGRKKETKKQKNYPRIKGKHESPKKKTKKETLSKKGRIMHCSKCGLAGHNAARCPSFPKEKQPKKKKQKVDDNVSQAPDAIPLTQPSQQTQASTDMD